MPGRTSRRLMWTVLVLVALALLLPPFINVNRYRSRVAASIGRALGRQVTASQIKLQVLPRPGIILSNFVVAEDPSFGYEPVLRAQTVTALLRLSSLWRGRLEIGILELDSPSLNLVRRADGHWNFESVVQRAEQVPSAPTAKRRPESRPRFPYVEATSGRINIKLDSLKLPFSFTDADFGLWLQSQDEWGVRLEGRPMRTDIPINDPGVVNLEGSLRQSADLQDMQVSLKASYAQGQLGQLTKAIFTKDKGWRGAVTAAAALSGTPSALGITFDGEVNDFRRYDIATGEALRLRTHCTAQYSTLDQSFKGLQCDSPVGKGFVQVRGNVKGWRGENYDLGISGMEIPMERVLAFARHAKKDLPADLTAIGEAGAAVTVRKSDGDLPVWSGGGTTDHFALRSSVLKDDLDIGQIDFEITQNNTGAPGAKPGGAHAAKPIRSTTLLQLVVKPFAFPLGAASPATATAIFNGNRYEVHVTGPAELSALLNVARAFGVGTPGVGLAGASDLDLQIAGGWAGFGQPAASGKIQLRNATAELQGIAAPLQISSATASLSGSEVNLSNFNASFPEGPNASGSARFPAHCSTPETCVVHFDVHTSDVSLARLDQLFNPKLQTTPWYRLLAVWQRRDDALLKLRAQGHFSAARVALAALSVTNVSGTAELEAGQLRVTDLRADMLGGHQTGTWSANFTVAPPVFWGEGTVSKLSMAQLAALMHDNWATGTADGSYRILLAGATAEALRNSADGTASFTWNNGSLRHVALDGRGAPLAFSTFSGKLVLQSGKLAFDDGKLQTSGGLYSVKGFAAYDRSLDMRLEHAGGRSYVISGPLDKPHVDAAPPPSTEAALR